MEDSNENTMNNHVIDEGTQTDSNTSNYDDDDEQYQYEEIDLKSVPNIQTVNDKDVEEKLMIRHLQTNIMMSHCQTIILTYHLYIQLRQTASS